MKTVDEIMKEISTLTSDERNKLFDELAKLYYAQVFAVGENFDFWFDGADDVYDEILSE
jgi:hypothetical protein